MSRRTTRYLARTRQPINAKTGQFMAKYPRSTADLPASVRSDATLTEHLKVHADRKRMARKIAQAAWKGDWNAMALLIQAAQQMDQRSSPPSNLDFTRLFDLELRIFQRLYEKAARKVSADYDVLQEFFPRDDEVAVIVGRQYPKSESASTEVASTAEPAATVEPAAVAAPEPSARPAERFGAKTDELYRRLQWQRQQQERQQAQEETPSLHVDELRRPASECGPFDWTNY